MGQLAAPLPPERKNGPEKIGEIPSTVVPERQSVCFIRSWGSACPRRELGSYQYLSLIHISADALEDVTIKGGDMKITPLKAVTRCV